MHRHAWATFQTTFPEDGEFPHAPGYPIARHLEARLRDAGIEVTGVDLWRDSGWEVDCRIREKRVYLFFVRLLDGSDTWVLCCTIAPRERGAGFESAEESAASRLPHGDIAELA